MMLTVSLMTFGLGVAQGAPVTVALTRADAGAADLPSDRATDIPLEDNQDKVKLTIHVQVPQRNRWSTQFTVYPYPVEPPTSNPHLLTSLQSVSSSNLKTLLLSLGYSNRIARRVPYPMGGYRTNYAYQQALKRYGGGVPHSLSEVYRWIDEILPYFENEMLKMNEIQRARSQRLDKMREEFADTRADIEAEAVNKELYPQDVRIGTWQGTGQKGEVMLTKGKWWVTGTYKTLGLTFYWQEPIDLSQGDQSLELTDANALLIQGAW